MEGCLLQLQAAQERCETNQTRTLAPERFHHPCKLCRFQHSNEIHVILAAEHKWPSRPQFVSQKSITRGVARGKQQAFEQPKFSKIVPWESGRLLSRSLQQLEFMLQVLIYVCMYGRVQFHKKDRRDVQHGDSTVYETELMEPLGHAEQDRAFFNRLDAQLNKINRFYKLKEKEYTAQARRLERQLLAMFHVQEALARQNLILQSSSKSSGDENSNSSSDDESIGKYFDELHAVIAP
jgi:hypothetical protein